MAESSEEEKTESPTQKRRDDARKEGQVAHSKEVTSALMLGSFLLIGYFAGNFYLEIFAQAFRTSFQNLNLSELNIPMVQGLTMEFFKLAAWVVLPMFVTALVVGVLASAAQVGFHITGKPLEPSLDKINPIKGFGRMFSKQAFMELIKGLFKMGVIGYIGYATFMEHFQQMQNLASSDAKQLIFITFKIIGIFAFRLFLALMVLALLDYLFQRWDLEQKLKMSKQDIKEEIKQSEGDPQIKARIRQIQQEMSRARMMQEVPKADVVVTNPTHFAVAMRYDREVMIAPEVIAKGTDHMARRIIEIAKENGVVVYENPPVARGLYYQVEIGQGIPEEFFRAVAEILAFVYRTKKRR